VIQEQVGSPIRYGTSVASAERSGTMADVRLTDGTRRTVDLLVGADGAHSRVRELVFGPEHRFLRYLDHQVSAYILRDEELSRRIGARYRMLTVPGRMAGGYALRDGRLALLFLRHETDSAIPADPAAALRRHFGDLGWILPEVLPRCPRPPELYHDQVTQIEMARWSEGRVVLLGDACQAVSLFAGHGASLGMAAAWVLADELAHGEVAGALIRYEERMRPAVEEVQRAGRRFVKWMAPATRRHIMARDLMIRLAGLPGLGRLFVNSLSPGGHRLITSRADHLDDNLDDARDRA
jgi:2-polyprenyl-6-methoxyphenol hydroxylase-like FAD-dependent oxidoreductase